MRVYITKYALTQGIEAVRATACPSNNKAVGVKHSPTGYVQYIYKPDWHTAFSEARSRAEEMRQRKIVSLQRSLARMKALTFHSPKGKS